MYIVIYRICIRFRVTFSNCIGEIVRYVFFQISQCMPNIVVNKCPKGEQAAEGGYHVSVTARFDTYEKFKSGLRLEYFNVFSFLIQSIYNCEARGFAEPLHLSHY